MTTGSPFSANPGPFPPPPDPRAPNSRSLVWVLACVALAFVCICSGLCILPTGFGIYRAASQSGKLTQTIDECLQDVAKGNLPSALHRFSSRAQDQGLVTLAQLVSLRQSPHFAGYESLSADNVSINFSANSDPKKPQGTVATLTGSVTYQDGGTGTFQTTLELEQGQWRLFSVDLQRNAAEEVPSEAPANAEAP